MTARHHKSRRNRKGSAPSNSRSVVTRSLIIGTDRVSESGGREEPGGSPHEAPRGGGNFRHVDTLNMIWIEGRAERAPTLDSIESYVQTWIEDCAYVDEDSDNGECDADINEVEKEQKGERKNVGAQAPSAQGGIRRGMRTLGTSIGTSSTRTPRSR